MMQTGMRLALATILAIPLLFSASQAKTKLKDACGTDLEKFCKDVAKGNGRKACLRTHSTELQPACADLLKERDADKAAQKAK